MDAFRISLIVVGITVLLAIYVFDSNKNVRTYFERLNFNKIRTYFETLNLKQYFTKKNHPDDDYAHEPEIDDDSEILEHIEQMEGVVANPYSESNLSAESQLLEDVEDDIVELTDEVTTSSSSSLGEEMVVAFFILSKNENYFSGTDINEVCTANGFEYSDKNTYEKFSDRNLKDNRAVATIVNSFEPGIFDSDFENFDTKAITVILYLPGPDSEMAAFEDIIMRSRTIAHALNGELCDETRSVLTPQTISHIKEKIEAFQFKNKMLKTSQQH